MSPFPAGSASSRSHVDPEARAASGLALGAALWRAYAAAPLLARCRVVSRYALCPFGDLLRCIPAEGDLVDIGCGDALLGVLLWRTGSAVRYTGLDHAEDKIDVARKGLPVDAVARVGAASDLPPASADCVVIVDVLYCVPLDQWGPLLQACVAALKPGGVLVVRGVVSDLPRARRWKHCLSYVQEVFAIQVLGMTKGERPHFETAATHRDHLRLAGVEMEREVLLDSWRPHGHRLFVGRKPC